MNTNILHNLSCVLRVFGADANTYLQGQFSQDLSSPVGAATYGLWLTEKGKVLADSHILRIGEQEFMVVFPGGRDSSRMLQLIVRNIIADEVEVVDVSKLWAEIDLWGPSAMGIFRRAFETVPARGQALEWLGSFSFLGRLAGEDQSIRLLVPASVKSECWQRLQDAGAVTGTGEELLRSRILAGLPAVPEDVGASDLPNEGGLETVAVSYTKGCYLGQEVTNRLKTMGQVRRRLHVVQGNGAVPAPHTEIYQQGRKVGEIRSAAQSGDGFAALAMLTLLQLDVTAGVSCSVEGPVDVRIVRPV